MFMVSPFLNPCFHGMKHCLGLCRRTCWICHCCYNLTLAIQYTMILVMRRGVRLLSYEVLRKLQETESHADEMVSKAEERARGIVRDARSNAQTLIKNAKAEAAAEGESIIKAEEAKAQTEATEVLKKSSVQCNKLRDVVRAKIPRAADLVVERIVTSSGNR